MWPAKILYLGKRALESGVRLSTNNHSFPWRLTLKYLVLWRLSVKPFDSWRLIPFWAPIIQPISSHPALNKYCLKYTFPLKKNTLLNSRKRKEMPGGVFVIAQVRCNKILAWLRGFLTGHFSKYLVWFSLCSSFFWELWDSGVVKNLLPRSNVRIYNK